MSKIAKVVGRYAVSAVLAVGILVLVNEEFGILAGLLTIGAITVSMGTAVAVIERNQFKTFQPTIATGITVGAFTHNIAYGFIGAVFAWVVITMLVQVRVKLYESQFHKPRARNPRQGDLR